MLGLRGFPHVSGGIESHCELLYPAVAERHPDLRITVLMRRPYVPAPPREYRGLELRSLWAPRQPGWETLVHSLLAVLYARFKLKADVVHIHGIGPGLFVPLARMLGAKVVVTYHSRDDERAKFKPLVRVLLRAGGKTTALFAHRIVAVSKSIWRHLLLRYPSAAPRVAVIPHAAHGEPPQVSATKLLEDLDLQPGRYFLAVGRIELGKRFHDLVEAYGQLTGPTYPLVIAGEGFGSRDYEFALRQAAGPGVRFVGFRSREELSELYANAALMIHPSESEGFGLVVLEALLQHAPVALSDIDAHVEFALPKERYFTPGDLPAIRDLFMQSQHPRESETYYRQLLSRHALHEMVDQYAALYRSVLGRDRATSEKIAQ